MLFHDSVADAQSEPRSLANTLRRIERFEDTARFFYAGSGVLDFDCQGSIDDTHPHHQAMFFGLLTYGRVCLVGHRVQAVVYDVEEDLLQLVRISEHRGDFRLKITF